MPAAGSARIRREPGRAPRCGDLATIVRTSWAWHARHPEGYGE
ncbi:MAG: hypothetical protein QME76_11265 [Bacillota bacterium]|nr:hypothetical protein [Bacillota bacterium]